MNPSTLIAPTLTGVTKYVRGAFSVFEIDTARALYQGIPWRTLGRFGRRKFENLIFITHPRERVKFVYV